MCRQLMWRLWYLVVINLFLFDSGSCSADSIKIFGDHECYCFFESLHEAYIKINVEAYRFFVDKLCFAHDKWSFWEKSDGSN